MFCLDRGSGAAVSTFISQQNLWLVQSVFALNESPQMSSTSVHVYLHLQLLLQ